MRYDWGKHGDLKVGDLVEVTSNIGHTGLNEPAPVGARGVVMKQCINPYYFTVFIDERLVNIFQNDVKLVGEM